ncbi:MAG TPA: methyltransferase domain-containing protein [Anaerolineae bacterium]|nr:methyltransferase domain-containing protein [Anaerolineae bacterium]
MNTVERANQDYYDRVSQIYDRKHNISRDDFSVFVRQIARLCEAPIQGMKVLDCGCGTGRGAIKFALLGNAVVAVDISENMGRACRHNALAEGLALQPGVCDCAKLPFSAESFDVVTTSAALHHMRDLEASIREFWRVLRPGGRCLFIAEPKQALIRPAWMRRIKERLSARYDREAVGLPASPVDPDMYIFALDGFQEALGQLGFSNIRTDCFFTLTSVYRDLIFYRLHDLSLRNALYRFCSRIDYGALAWLPSTCKSLFTMMAEKTSRPSAAPIRVERFAAASSLVPRPPNSAGLGRHNRRPL